MRPFLRELFIIFGDSGNLFVYSLDFLNNLGAIVILKYRAFYLKRIMNPSLIEFAEKYAKKPKEKWGKRTCHVIQDCKSRQCSSSLSRSDSPESWCDRTPPDFIFIRRKKSQIAPPRRNKTTTKAMNK